MELSPPAAVHAAHRKIFTVAGEPHAALPGEKLRNCGLALSLKHRHSAAAREKSYSPKYLSATAMPSS